VQKRNDHIFWAMMIEFSKIKCIMGKPGHELTCFVLVVKFEGESLIMLKEFTPHISFHQGAHDMPLIVNKCATCCISSDQAEHEATHHVDLMESISCPDLQKISCNESNT